MKIIWSEEKIREEMKRLDRITSLNGAKLPILFNNSKYRLGCFFGGDEMYFQFSDFWFQDPEWTQESALDTIRHEYAHYMDQMLYGNYGHGKTWKACCSKVGARPKRLYNEQFEKYYKNRIKEQKATISEFDTYNIGDRIKHPMYETGKIIDIQGEGISKLVTIEFETGSKQFTLDWINRNCKRSVSA